MMVKFFANEANSGYLNGLALEFGESTNAIRLELNNLSDAGYLIRWKSKNKIVYAANIKHPLFKLLQQIIRHHLGLEQIVSSVINKLGSVQEIHLIGDYAKGRDSGTIEIILIGQNINEDYLVILQNKLKKLINRTVLFYVNSTIPSNGIVIYYQNNPNQS
jgi:hypothetical protein|tara:strand:- start:2946 stop:3428 length:483 start_codon:yes stop_codon:yes gene_type:complete